MNTIKLGSRVIVSDPSYQLPTWCQAQVDDVLEGDYVTTAVRSTEGGWGERCSFLIAIHKDHYKPDEKLTWRSYPAEIGVDSGQAGIFNSESYRKDDHHIDGEPYDFGWEYDKEPGDTWYRHMCERTLSNEHWGTYDQGVVASSGIGDGCYVLYVAKKNKKVVGFVINFFMSRKSIKNVVNEFLPK